MLPATVCVAVTANGAIRPAVPIGNVCQIATTVLFASTGSARARTAVRYVGKDSPRHAARARRPVSKGRAFARRLRETGAHFPLFRVRIAFSAAPHANFADGGSVTLPVHRMNFAARAGSANAMSCREQSCVDRREAAVSTVVTSMIPNYVPALPATRFVGMSIAATPVKCATSIGAWTNAHIRQHVVTGTAAVLMASRCAVTNAVGPAQSATRDHAFAATTPTVVDRHCPMERSREYRRSIAATSASHASDFQVPIQRMVRRSLRASGTARKAWCAKSRSAKVTCAALSVTAPTAPLLVAKAQRESVAIRSAAIARVANASPNVSIHWHVSTTSVSVQTGNQRVLGTGPLAAVKVAQSALMVLAGVRVVAKKTLDVYPSSRRRRGST